MSLSGALQIGKSGLLASQTAIQVAGNNLANVATAGYHRQVLTLAPVSSQEIQDGVFVGRGVQVQAIARQIDAALEGRVRSSVADESGSTARSDLLAQIESMENELSGYDLSTQLGQFFDAWSSLANSSADSSLRALVAQQGTSLAGTIQNLRAGVATTRDQLDANIQQSATGANDLLTQIQDLNGQIAQSNTSTGGDSTLRDQRDALLNQLSQYMNISVVEQSSGADDVFVGSIPIMLNGQSRGIAIRKTTTSDGQLKMDVVVQSDGSLLAPTSGKLGALIDARKNDVNAALDTIDSFTNQLIYQVNRIHSQGQGQVGYTTVTGTNAVTDANAALNASGAGLKFTPVNGSFEISLTQKSTGQIVTSRINVDLNGTGSDTTLNSLAAQIDALAGISASVTAGGQLKIDSDAPDYEVSFANDTSGALAALGVNTFFSGGNGLDIAVNNVVNANPSLVAAGQNHVSGDNTNALALASLRTQTLSDLGGLSLTDVWRRHVEDYAVRSGQAKQQLQADTVVRQNLEAQQQSVSGVNVDEESIDLMSYQRAYQASARFITTVDQMMQTLLNIT